MTLKRKEVAFGIAGNVLYLDLGVVTEVYLYVTIYQAVDFFLFVCM